MNRFQLIDSRLSGLAYFGAICIAWAEGLFIAAGLIALRDKHPVTGFSLIAVALILIGLSLLTGILQK